MTPRPETYNLLIRDVGGVGEGGTELLIRLFNDPVEEETLDSDIRFLNFIENLPEELTEEQIEALNLALYSDLDYGAGEKRVTQSYKRVRRGLLRHKGFKHNILEMSAFFTSIKLPLPRLQPTYMITSGLSDWTRKFRSLIPLEENQISPIEYFLAVYYDFIDRFESAISSRDFAQIIAILNEIGDKTGRHRIIEDFWSYVKDNFEGVTPDIVSGNSFAFDLEFLIKNSLRDAGFISIAGYASLDTLRKKLNTFTSIPKDIIKEILDPETYNNVYGGAEA